MATLNAGSGADGNATVSADTNISTTSLVGRSYADMVPYQCSSVGASSCVTSATPDGIEAGDEVLLINWQGISGDTDNVGNYETFIVDNVNTNTITFTTDKTKFFGDTSDTDSCTGGTATASNSTGSNTPNKAFDDNTGTFWQTQTSNPWLKYELSSAATIVKYSIQNHTFTAQTPQAWTFEGSNNDSDWTVLDTVTGQTGWTSTQIRTFRCDTSGEYLYYRINISADNDSGDEVILSNVSMYAATDTNIGTSSSNQRVRVQRIPQYNNLTIDNGYSLTANDAWDTGTGGILFLRAAGTILVNGSIDMTGKGYTGGYNNYSGTWYMRTGAGIDGGPRAAAKTTSTWHTTSNLGGGGRGGWYTGSDWCGGHGGGYGTAGGVGTRAGNGAASGGAGGTTYGEQTLSKLFMGSGGGSSIETGTESGDTKSDGGGILALFTTTLDIYGSILCRGQNGTGDASSVDGGGSGGSILIHAGTIYTRSSTFDATGIVGRTGNQVAKGGDGGDGRIAITYAALGDSLASVDPVPYTDDTLELPYSISGTASADCTVRVYDASWTFVKSQAVSAGAYEISNLPSSGPFNVVSDPDSGSYNVISYKGVTPSQ